MKERRLHLDLTDSTLMHRNIGGFTRELDRLYNTRSSHIVPQELEEALSLASPELIDKKLKDDGEFKIAHFAVTHSKLDSVLAAEEIARRTPGINLLSDENVGLIDVPGRGIVASYLPGTGAILTAEGIDMPRKEGVPSSQSGMDVLHLMSCLVEQDVAYVVKLGRALIYDFDASRHEKTPKDPVTGENHFVGREIIEFHDRAKTVGPQIAHTLRYLTANFAVGTIDHLTVDLRGANTYSNGDVTVHRFERDHFVPIYTPGRRPDGSDHRESMNTFVLIDNGKKPLARLHGILGYAEVFFQPEGETKSPFEGGTVVDVPLDFYQTFRVQK